MDSPGAWSSLSRGGNGLRTKLQTVDDSPAGTEIDQSALDKEDDIVGITVVPAVVGAVEIQGKDGNDFVTVPGGGVQLEIDFKRGTPLPKIRAKAGNEAVTLLLSVYTR